MPLADDILSSAITERDEEKRKTLEVRDLLKGITNMLSPKKAKLLIARVEHAVVKYKSAKNSASTRMQLAGLPEKPSYAALHKSLKEKAERVSGAAVIAMAAILAYG